MKISKKEQEKRLKEMIALREKRYTMSDIGKLFGLSRQRVYQILTPIGKAGKIEPTEEELKERRKSHLEKKSENTLRNGQRRIERKKNTSVLRYHHNRKKRDPSYIILRRLHSRLRDSIRAGARRSHSKELIGCSLKKLNDHLEKQFKKGMSWENYGEWQVDHIRPCRSFDLEDQAQQIVCFNWRNLCPLTIAKNRAKRDKYDPLDELAWVERMQSLGYEGELFLKYEEGNSY